MNAMLPMLAAALLVTNQFEAAAVEAPTETYEVVKPPKHGHTMETVRDPRLDGARVTDHAHIIDLSFVQNITREIHGIEADVRGSSVLVVTVDDIHKKFTPKRFATALFNTWKIGSRDKNNGVLVLVVKSKRRVEIEVGKGLMWHLSKEWCTGMLNEYVVPAFRAVPAEYGYGLNAAIQQIGARMRDDRGALWALAAVAPRLARLAFAAVATPVLVAAFHSSWAAGRQRDRCQRACGRCNMVVPESAIGTWQTTRLATNRRNGERRRKYTCTSCGHHSEFVQLLPMYDAVRYRHDDTPSYYNYRSSNDRKSETRSRNRGGSSSGGGGGASW